MLAKIRTAIPRRQPGLIDRQNLPSPLEQAVTVVSAPAGYGKSQLLARWCEDAAVASQVAYGVCSRLGETASTLLELLYSGLQLSERFQSEVTWQQQADTLLEALFEMSETVIVLDDVHHLEGDTSEAEECSLLLSYLLDYRAPHCHWVFCGRSKPRLADLELQIMTGQTVLLSTQELSLSLSQLEEMCPGQGEHLFELTSGWPLACAVLLKCPPEKWDDQREKLSQGLLELAIRELSSESKRAVAILGVAGAASRQELEKHGLWPHLEPLLESTSVVLETADKLTVHPLFADQYREQAGEQERESAVALLLESGRTWEALEVVTDSETLSQLLEEHGPSLLQAGRFRLLEKLLERAQDRPSLNILLGKLLWFRGDAAGALDAFHRSAESAHSLGDSETVYGAWLAAGQLYIDAVCPTEAIDYLKKAYRALGPLQKKEKAHVLGLLAENAINVGQARTAQRYRALARQWDRQKSEDLSITARLLLRAGRLGEAQGTVQVAIKENKALDQGLLEGHRDPRLVLSYICAVQGLARVAGEMAETVLSEALEQEDKRSQSVALARLAHARLLEELSGEKQAEKSSLQLYSEADSLAKTLGVERLRAEPLMGLARYYSIQGNIPRAYEACREGVSIAQRSGDSWLSSWLNLVQAVAACEGGHPSGAELLQSAQAEFKACRDRFGFALCDIWSALTSGKADAGAGRHLNEFGFLAERPSLFAPAPGKVANLRAPGENKEAPKTLQVFCLGPLSLIRDGDPVPNKAFKRKKARELFVLLLASPDTFFHREELAEQLWPQASQKAALRDFRVALHALSDALEPERPKNTTAFCIDRQEERYRLLSHKLDLDTARFEALTQPEIEESAQWERAVRLYRGCFCEDYPYIESLEGIRQRYDQLYLQTAERLGAHYLESEQAPKATELAQRMLQRDPTWEPAYRLLMRAHHAQGHEHLLPRTFTRCLETLENELGVEPGEETFELARELLGDQLATLL